MVIDILLGELPNCRMHRLHGSRDAAGYEKDFPVAELINHTNVSFERDLCERIFAEHLLNQCIYLGCARHFHERPPWIDAVVDPRWLPVAGGLDELLGEVALPRERIHRLDLEAAIQAHVHIRLYDRVFR